MKKISFEDSVKDEQHRYAMLRAEYAELADEHLLYRLETLVSRRAVDQHRGVWHPPSWEEYQAARDELRRRLGDTSTARGLR